MLNTNDLLQLRPILNSDLDAVLAIERKAHSHPWSIGIFSDCLKHNYRCLLHEAEDKVIAYAIISTAVQEMHILNLTVNPDYQQQGLGKCLLNTLEMIGHGLDARECFLEVRPSNTAAIRLYLNNGFNEIGLRKNYYPTEQGHREDALLMAKVLLD